MSHSSPRTCRKERRDDIRRSFGIKEWTGSNPYSVTQHKAHPYHPNNSSNPYAQKPTGAQGTYRPRSRQFTDSAREHAKD